MVGQWHADSPTCTVYVDVTLTQSKVKVKVTGFLNVQQLAKPCMLVPMIAAPLRGFLVFFGCVSMKLADNPLLIFAQNMYFRYTKKS